MGDGPARVRPRTWILAALGLALIALAGPSWRETPVPVGASRDAMIVVFDLSPSMLAGDLSPDRLTRARLKLIDLLRRRTDGETALIAYAGGAHRVAPLTDDTKTIEVLVPSLHPEVMPSRGSEVEAAVQMASDLLKGAALERGTLVLITDGIVSDAVPGVRRALGDRLDLCLLVVGTDERVPIPLARGGFLRDGDGQTRLTQLDRGALRRLSESEGGCYAELRSDDADLDRILRFAEQRANPDTEDSERTFDVRQDEGFRLVLILLPAALLIFRRGVLWCVLLVAASSSLAPASAEALEWADLWQRPDQRLESSIREGVDLYRSGQYNEAAEQFKGDSPTGAFNRGNAQAQLGDLEQAIASYQAALDADPEHTSAAHNKAVLEDYLEQQQEQQPQQEPGDSGDQEGDETQEDQNGEPEQGDSGQNEAPPSDPQSGDQDPSPSETEDSERGSAEKTDPEERGSQNKDDPASRPEDPESEAEDGTEPPREVAPPTDEPLSDQSEQFLRNIPDDRAAFCAENFNTRLSFVGGAVSEPRPTSDTDDNARGLSIHDGHPNETRNAAARAAPSPVAELGQRGPGVRGAGRPHPDARERDADARGGVRRAGRYRHP